VLLAFLVALPAALAYGAVGALLVLTSTVFLSYGGAPVVVGDGTFRAGRAQIPVHLLAEPEALDETRTREVAGPQADARAYLLLRPYLRHAVMVDVVDPADPAPYWLVSTRHPRSLAAALTAAIAESPAPGSTGLPGFPA